MTKLKKSRRTFNFDARLDRIGFHSKEAQRKYTGAVVEFHPNGSYHTIYMYKDGLLHNDEGPAIVENRSYGFILKVWFKEGRRHRTDGPATTEDWLHFDNGNRLETQAYYLYGKIYHKIQDGKKYSQYNTNFEEDLKVAILMERAEKLNEVKKY